MRYLLLIRGDESAAAHADEGCFGWSERMGERGVLQGGGGLRPPAEGKAVRIRRRQLMLSDGPFARHPEASLEPGCTPSSATSASASNACSACTPGSGAAFVAGAAFAGLTGTSTGAGAVEDVGAGSS